MSARNPLIELAEKLNGIAIISSEISPSDINEGDIDFIVLHANDYFEGKDGLRVLDKDALSQIIKTRMDERSPMQIEVHRSAGFKPEAKDVEPSFKVRNMKPGTTTSSTDSFVEFFRDRFERQKRMIESNPGSMYGIINSIDAIKQYATGREVALIGMVSEKAITKNGHVLLTIEDETDTAKVLVPLSESVSGKELFEKGRRTIVEDVIAVRGKLSGSLIIANGLSYPDIPIRPRKTTEEDFSIAFLSDIHVGSKLFLEKSFTEMLKWLNNGLDYRKDILGKIKYIMISGDLVDGIGVYPNQDRDLAVLDIYKQYGILFDFLESVPDYIHVFVLPGNHDGVHRAEPQPELGPNFIGDFKQDNIHFVSNPGYVTLHGMKILAYHGTSLDSIIHNVPGCNYSRPELAMVETLKRRHLSPVYGGNNILPSKRDCMVIDEVPDILHMGHEHRNGVTDHHGTLVVNSGTWQSKTDYQLKQGHIPTPCVVPIYETKTAKMTSIDFNMVT